MKLIVLNLPRDFAEDALKALFATHGNITACNLVLDDTTGTSKGFGFVEMASYRDATTAIKKLHGSKLGENRIRVKPVEQNKRPVLRKITVDALVVMPWKNGGGVTTEIATGPSRSDDSDWSWRVSVADVGETGPFSVFPGIDRTIAVIEGAGMDLKFDDGRMLPLELDHPVDFDGGASVDGLLRGTSIRDFNVMVDRRYYSATLGIVLGPDETSYRAAAGSVVLVHVLDGAGTMRAAAGAAETLGAHETAIYEGETEITVSVAADARAAIVVLEDISGQAPAAN